LNVKTFYIFEDVDTALAAQAEYYASVSGEELAREFEDAVKLAVRSVLDNPERGDIVPGLTEAHRRVRIQRFKQYLYYRINRQQEDVLIIHLRGQRQRPLTHSQLAQITEQAEAAKERKRSAPTEDGD